MLYTARSNVPFARAVAEISLVLANRIVERHHVIMDRLLVGVENYVCRLKVPYRLICRPRAITYPQCVN